MTAFRSASQYWDFARSVRSGRRYIHTKEARDFLRAVTESADRRVNEVARGVFLWRAQRGSTTIEVPIHGTDDTTEEDYPFDVGRMKPLAGRAKEGRANPKGIPYLYLATHRDTAVAEVRPWKGAVVSVGQFMVVRKLRLVNTTLSSKQAFYLGGEPSPRKREEAVWGDIEAAFATPTTASDDTSDYVPTQILAEALRDSGFDGIGYRSAYGGGHNVALFDIGAAEQRNCFLVRVKDVKFEFKVDEQYSYTIKRRKRAT
jgi:hypothetical protein